RQPVSPPRRARPRRVLDPRRLPARAGDRPREPLGDRRDRGHAAGQRPADLPAGAVSAVGRQGHHHPGRAGPHPGWAVGPGVSRPGHPPGGRRRLPRHPLQDLPERVTWTTRIQRNGVLYQPAPPPTGKRGRPRTKGDRIGTPAQAAGGAPWRQAAVARYGRTDIVRIAEVDCLWYGAFGKRTGRLIAADEGAGEGGRPLPVVANDMAAPAEQIITRYAARGGSEG